MVKQLVRRSGAFGMLPLLLSAVVLAHGQTTASNSGSATTATSPSQGVGSLLSTLPEADMIIYINPQRILNEIAPKLMPEADLSKMRRQFSDLKQFAGVDPSRIDYMVLAIRFLKPPADLSFQAPEFLVVTSGDFSAESLLTLARLGLQDKLREEQYGSKTLALVTIDELSKEAEKNPILKSFTQLGLVSLNNNTIAAGNISYLKAAVDAAGGRNRIAQQTLNSLLRDTNALISIGGSPWTSFAKSFGLMGTENNPRPPRCDSKMGDFYAAVTLEGNNFKLRGAMNADNADTARIINSLISGLLQTAANASGADKSAQAALKMFTIRTQDDEVRLEADIPQQIVLDYVREQMKPKPAPSVKVAKPAARPARKQRRRAKP